MRTKQINGGEAMRTLSKTEWPEYVTDADIGKIVLYNPSGQTCAVEDTLDECIREWVECSGEVVDIDDVSTTDDYSGGLAAAIVDE